MPANEIIYFLVNLRCKTVKYYSITSWYIHVVYAWTNFWCQLLFVCHICALYM